MVDFCVRSSDLVCVQVLVSHKFSDQKETAKEDGPNTFETRKGGDVGVIIRLDIENI